LDVGRINAHVSGKRDVFSPGGLGSAQKQEGVNFTEAVVHALEQKTDYARYYRRNFVNHEMATL